MVGFYKIKCNWSKDFVEKNISKIEKNYLLYPNRNKWNCDCHSIHDYEKDVEKINYDFLRDEYTKIANQICKDQKYHLSDIWYNYYKKQQFQEPHTHEGGFGFTAVHYLIYDPKVHSKTEFTNKEITPPDVEEGDLLIFPCWWEHFVKENNSEKPRLTVAFTITIDKI
tara:strand:+ start:1558 stop:2061 length:504 start_codon:yes stop_codon:yes gene_type:complete